MNWIQKYRQSIGMSRGQFARAITSQLGGSRDNRIVVPEKLIYMLEEWPKCYTHPKLADMIAAACAFLALCAAMSKKGEHKWRYVAAFLIIAAVGAVMTISGARQPMQKVIYCCASGPVNLETVAATYDIIEVDGAFIKIAER